MVERKLINWDNDKRRDEHKFQRRWGKSSWNATRSNKNYRDEEISLENAKT